MTLSAARSLTASFGWTRFTVSGYFGMEKCGA